MKLNFQNEVSLCFENFDAMSMNGRFFEEKYLSDAIGPSLRSSVKQFLKELGLDALDKKTVLQSFNKVNLFKKWWWHKW